MGVPIEVSFKEMCPNHIFSDQEFSELLLQFRRNYQQLENKYLVLFPGISEMLNELQSKNKDMYVASSKHSTALLRNLKSLGINHYFKSVIGSDKVTHFKPNPESLLMLIEEFNLNVNKCVMVGDAIFDLQMGKNAGVRTCGVSWGSHKSDELLKENPDFLIESPVDLLNI